jgi:hypothetical protein
VRIFFTFEIVCKREAGQRDGILRRFGDGPLKKGDVPVKADFANVKLVARQVERIPALPRRAAKVDV